MGRYAATCWYLSPGALFLVSFHITIATIIQALKTPLQRFVRSAPCTMAQTAQRSYMHTAPFDSGLLSVGSIHRIHYEQYGIKNGKPGNLLDIVC